MTAKTNKSVTSLAFFIGDFRKSVEKKSCRWKCSLLVCWEELLWMRPGLSDRKAKRKWLNHYHQLVLGTAFHPMESGRQVARNSALPQHSHQALILPHSSTWKSVVIYITKRRPSVTRRHSSAWPLDMAESVAALGDRVHWMYACALPSTYLTVLCNKINCLIN